MKPVRLTMKILISSSGYNSEWTSFSLVNALDRTVIPNVSIKCYASNMIYNQAKSSVISWF